ncbi:hypothetical protein CANARDRAFT_30211 [[Candida] arabinofermentans NRRL YB-2248]|uniref:Allantoin permease n=1 Tax=[Candida] arabinofermentans NRRL YB-2248 TaxID=983967 RepID=A0A1E4SUK6_9ASCO|nr:hypothetical protein CANARDRAFT_30211 [[Candida] arabinofermentans NRRL YB-2248]
MPIAATGLFVYSICKGHGVGDWDIGPVNLRSSTVGNTWISIINSIVGNISPMIVNQPDVSRYANDRKHVVIPQALGFIPPKICILLFGMISTVCLKRAYGETYWNVWDILNAILDNEWGPAARVLIWFVSISFAIGSIGLNIFANTIPFAADLASLLPEYFTIIRAQVFVGLLAWAVVPWRFLSSAQKFLTFLSSYSMFVGPILGGMLADYYVVRRGNIHVPSLYTKSSSGAYHFYKGCNIWAILCWVACPVIAIPGLIRAYHPNVSTQTATDIYNGSWIYTLLMCFTLHSVCGLYFKPKLYSDGHETSPKTWEYLGEFNGFFEDDVPINGVGYPGTVERDYEDKSSSGDEKGDGDVLVVEVFDSKV